MGAPRGFQRSRPSGFTLGGSRWRPTAPRHPRRRRSSDSAELTREGEVMRPGISPQACFLIGGSSISQACAAPSAGPNPSRVVAIWRHGWVSFRVNRPPAASRACWGSANAATSIFASCWFMGRGRRCPTWPSGIRRSVAGRKDCSAAPIRMLWWWRLANKLARIAWAVLRRGEPFAAEGMLATA